MAQLVLKRYTGLTYTPPNILYECRLCVQLCSMEIILKYHRICIQSWSVKKKKLKEREKIRDQNYTYFLFRSIGCGIDRCGHIFNRSTLFSTCTFCFIVECLRTIF